MICGHGDCCEEVIANGLCRLHYSGSSVALTLLEAQRLDRLERIEIEQTTERAKTRLQAAAAAGFALAGSAAALGVGGGALGVVFVIGAITGVFCLAKANL